MHRFTLVAGAFLFTLLTLGCGGGGGTGHDGGVSAGGFTNSGFLTGDPVGLDLDLPSKLSRVVPVSISGSDLSATTAYLGRTTATEDGGCLIVPVTNQGNRWHCFIQVATYELFDTTGTSMGASDGNYNYIDGSVGRTANSLIYTNTCLEPGGTGYWLSGTSGSVFTSLGSITIVATSVDADYLPPETSVVPVSYTVIERDQVYTVTIANQGPMTATLYRGKAIYFDDSGIPVYWGSVHVVPTSSASVMIDLAPGASAQMTSDSRLTQWTGTSTRQLVMIAFDVYANKQATKAQLPGLAPDLDAEHVSAVQRARATKREALRVLQ